MAGLLGNGAIVGLYLVTRTVGIPLLGPAAGVVEAVGWGDLVSKFAELGLIVCLLRLLRANRVSARDEQPTTE